MSTYFTDGNASITLKANGIRKGDGWLLTRSWRPEPHDAIWVATKREAEQVAAEHLKLRRAHVAAIRARAEAVLTAAGLSCEPLLNALTEEFSK